MSSSPISVRKIMSRFALTALAVGGVLLFSSSHAEATGSRSEACSTVLNNSERTSARRNSSNLVPLMDRVKVAAVQFPLGEGSTPEALLAKIERDVRAAKARDAHLVVFPELITTELVDWRRPDRAQLEQIARTFTPRYERWLGAKAQELQISILGGTTPRIDGTNIVNTAYLALPDGRVLSQDKLYMTPDEQVWGWTPGTTLKMLDTPWGKTTILTCFDCEYAGVSNLLTEAAPEVILVPSWTSSRHGLNRVDFTAKARAIEHYAYVVKTGTVPSENGTLPHFGQATIVGPQDAGFAAGATEGILNQTAIVYGELDLRTLRQKRPVTGYYPGKEQQQRRVPIRIEN